MRTTMRQSPTRYRHSGVASGPLRGLLSGAPSPRGSSIAPSRSRRNCVMRRGSEGDDMNAFVARVEAIEGGIEFERRSHAELDEFAVFLLQVARRALVAENVYESLLFERANMAFQCGNAVSGLDTSLREMFRKANGRPVHGFGPCSDQDRTYASAEEAADATAWRLWLTRRSQGNGLTFEYARRIYGHARALCPDTTSEHTGKPGRPRIRNNFRRFVVWCLLALEGCGLPVTSRSPDWRYADSQDESLALALAEALMESRNTIALIWREAMYRVPKQSRKAI